MLGQIGDRKSLAWLQYFTLDRLEGERAVLHVRPGHREAASFLNTQRREQLAGMLGSILGRKIRVELETAAPAAPEADESAGTGAEGGTANARRQALGLPLVQRALEAFPDATFVGFRQEDQPTEPPPAPDDAADDEEPLDRE